MNDFVIAVDDSQNPYIFDVPGDCAMVGGLVADNCNEFYTIIAVYTSYTEENIKQALMTACNESRLRTVTAVYNRVFPREG